MKYNQAGIAFMPKAPKTAEATAITILRSLSHQFDFVAIRFKLTLIPQHYYKIFFLST